MEIGARPATHDDIDVLVGLYRALEEEQTALKDMWPLADGLAEPAEATLKDLLSDPESSLFLGTIDDFPFGFILARVEDLLPQAEGLQVASVRLVFTDEEARGVGVGEAMINAVLESFRKRGFTRFDAHVLPGHRAAKNFFESAGFAARAIVMHHYDQGDATESPRRA